MHRGRELLTVARLELGEVLRSRWLLACAVLYAVIACGFVLVGMRESSVMGFTGVGRALFAFTHALVLLLPLVGLGASSQVVNRAREDGALELIFSHPLRRSSWFIAALGVRFVALTAPLVLLVLGLVVWARAARGQTIPWGFLWLALATSSGLLFASVSTGMLISTFVRNQARALMLMLLVWASWVALVDFALVGMLLSWRAPPQVVFVLAALNPVQAARMGLLAACGNELSTLGPVGFFLANRIGPGWLAFVGVAWPTTLGLIAALVSGRWICRRDLL